MEPSVEKIGNAKLPTCPICERQLTARGAPARSILDTFDEPVIEVTFPTQVWTSEAVCPQGHSWRVVFGDVTGREWRIVTGKEPESSD